MRGALFMIVLALPAIARSAGDIVLTAESALVTPPMTLDAGVLHQPVRTELPAGGTAVFVISVPASGDYTISAEVNAPNGNQNSFYLTVDDSPAGLMNRTEFQITDGFAQQLVSWRGRGETDDPEFAPKAFALTAGEHRLVITGREPMRIRSLTLRPHLQPLPGTVEAFEQDYQAGEWRHRQERRERAARREADEEASRAAAQRRMAEHAARFELALAEAGKPAAQADGLKLLGWILGKLSSYYSGAGPEAVALLNDRHAADPRVGPIVAHLAHYLPNREGPMELGTRTLFQTVARNNPDPAARGQALLGLALLAKRDFDFAEHLSPGEKAREAGSRAIAAMELVARDYGSLPVLRDGASDATLRQYAERELRELRGLRIDMPAPDIVAPDLNGTPLKLSEHRGKVVMLVFWASWCGPCMAAVPKEKALVERYRDRPFVLLGVNGDDPIRHAHKAVEQLEIPWRSFWDGPESTISRAWNVRGWPTVYLIDHLGIIRERIFFKEEAIEPWVVAAERAATSPDRP